MPKYRVRFERWFASEITVDAYDESDAWSKAEDTDPEMLSCQDAEHEIFEVEEINYNLLGLYG